MFNQEIYNKWGLHRDATQFEINYKFYKKIIDTINVHSLRTLDGSNFNSSKKIDDLQILNKWKSKTLIQLNNEFEIISSRYTFPKNKNFYNVDPYIKSLFRILEISNSLKLLNYKSQEIEQHYEPLMFKFATKFLSINWLEEWICYLTDPILNNDFELSKEINIDWKIFINKNINNTIWYLENLCLWFNDIYNWYTNIIKKAINDITKSKIENILNHWIIYILTDFYLKYIFDQNDKVTTNYKKLYNSVLHSIKHMIAEQTFAVIAFKSIAFFINKLLKNNVIKIDDMIIQNFKLIIQITSSKRNQEKLIEMIFDNIQFNDK